MGLSQRQGQLFSETSLSDFQSKSPPRLDLSRETLENWQEKILTHQSTLSDETTSVVTQSSLFTESNTSLIDQIDPLKLTPLPLSFWRWPSSPHQGPAIYLVMDHPEICNAPIILYIGETIAAERRWKGEHDCKSYLSSYSEALGIVGLKNKLSIRFWTDVPKDTQSRRRLEQLLIQRWLPPFNKETRRRWATPFTVEF